MWGHSFQTRANECKRSSFLPVSIECNLHYSWKDASPRRFQFLIIKIPFSQSRRLESAIEKGGPLDVPINRQGFVCPTTGSKIYPGVHSESILDWLFLCKKLQHFTCIFMKNIVFFWIGYTHIFVWYFFLNFNSN